MVNGKSFGVTGSAEFALFAVWNGALGRYGEILRHLESDFEICREFEVSWSKEFYRDNISRLYERPIYRAHGLSGDDRKNRLSGKIGEMPFRLIVIVDREPKYTYKRTVSGEIALVNQRVHKAKYYLRDFFQKKYQVHSSNDRDEFFAQASLLIGPELLNDLCDAPSRRELQTLNRDLEGAGGWRDAAHLFSVLNLGANYVVLRNFELLPGKIAEGDIDVLCTRFQRFASLANMAQRPGRPYKGTTQIGNASVRLDVRYVGDGYYDPLWQRDILERRHFNGAFFQPSDADHFFSLFYHATVHSGSVKSGYAALLAALADRLDFDWYSDVALDDAASVAGFLNHYLSAAGYRYSLPIDLGVGGNPAVIKRLVRREDVALSRVRGLRGRIPTGVKRILGLS